MSTKEMVSTETGVVSLGRPGNLKVFIPSHLAECIPRSASLPKERLRWNANECLYGCYVHSSIVPTFHRRCYWLLQAGTRTQCIALCRPSWSFCSHSYTLKVYVSAISAEHARVENHTVGSHRLVSLFLKGALRLRPPRAPMLSTASGVHSIKWTVGTHVGASVDLSVEQLVQHILDRQQQNHSPEHTAGLCTTHW
ncbi:hypothetical protein CRUP_022228 [Coryphaenoides rupestris]|nr:hypothetical protein CRUP_022228 [Coryphaenoides rupestris]